MDGMKDDMKEKLQRLSAYRLIDVVKNYRQYGYSEKTRQIALGILEEQGITREMLKLRGEFENHTYQKAKVALDQFCSHFKILLILFFLLLITISIGNLILNSTPSYLIAGIPFLLVCAAFFVYVVKSAMAQERFYKIICREHVSHVNFIILIFFSLPFYILLYFVIRQQMRTKLKAIR